MSEPIAKENALDWIDGKFNPNHISWRTRKIELLFDLARRVEDGCIVELGTDEGMGALALYFGTQAGHKRPVYTIDPYVKCWSSALTTGWNEEKEAIFHKNMREFRVARKIVQVKKSAQDAAENWRHQVGLLFWDTTVDGANMADDLELWDKHLFPGSFFVARDKEEGTYGTWQAVDRFTRKSRRYTMICKELFTLVLMKNEISPSFSFELGDQDA